MIFSRKVIPKKVQQQEVIPEVFLDAETYDWTSFKHTDILTDIKEESQIETTQIDTNQQQEEQKNQPIQLSLEVHQIQTENIVTKKYSYNIKFNRLEHRQMQYLELKTTPKIPNMVDLRSKFMKIVDQGEINSSTSCALQALISYVMPNFIASRRFIYFNDQSRNSDQEFNLLNSIKSLITYGVCPESILPYDIYQLTERPEKLYYKEAQKHQFLSYKNIQQDLYNIKNALNQGFPFLVSIAIYESFENEKSFKTGMIQLPNPNKEQLVGYQSICVVGYNDIIQCFLCRNSLGDQIYGQLRGYCWIPFVYLLNSHLSSDLFTLISYEK